MKLNGFESVDWRNKEWSLAPILSPLGRDLFFGIRHLWAIPDGALAKRVVQEVSFESKIFYSSLEDLYLFERECVQIIDMVVFGCKSQSKIDQIQYYIYEEADFILNIIDGGYCQIYAREEKYLYLIAAEFSSITWIPLDHIKKVLLFFINNREVSGNNWLRDLEHDLHFQSLVGWAQKRRWNIFRLSILCGSTVQSEPLDPMNWLVLFFEHQLTLWIHTCFNSELTAFVAKKAEELTKLLLMD